MPLADLTLADFQEEHATADASLYDVLGAKRAVAAFTSFGSTGPQEVDRQIPHWNERLRSPTGEQKS